MRNASSFSLVLFFNLLQGKTGIPRRFRTIFELYFESFLQGPQKWIQVPEPCEDAGFGKKKNPRGNLRQMIVSQPTWPSFVLPFSFSSHHSLGSIRKKLTRFSLLLLLLSVAWIIFVLGDCGRLKISLSDTDFFVCMHRGVEAGFGVGHACI